MLKGQGSTGTFFFHGTKKDKKILRSKLKYEVQPYPKGKTNRYDITHKPSTQVIMEF